MFLQKNFEICNIIWDYFWWFLRPHTQMKKFITIGISMIILHNIDRGGGGGDSRDFVLIILSLSLSLSLFLFQELKVSHCLNVSDEGIQSVATNCPHLSILVCHGCPLLTSRSREVVGKEGGGAGQLKQITWTVYWYWLVYNIIIIHFCVSKQHSKFVNNASGGPYSSW